LLRPFATVSGSRKAAFRQLSKTRKLLGMLLLIMAAPKTLQYDKMTSTLDLKVHPQCS